MKPDPQLPGNFEGAQGAGMVAVDVRVASFPVVRRSWKRAATSRSTSPSNSNRRIKASCDSWALVNAPNRDATCWASHSPSCRSLISAVFGSSGK